jgi:hypothetical protein
MQVIFFPYMKDILSINRCCKNVKINLSSGDIDQTDTLLHLKEEDFSSSYVPNKYKGHLLRIQSYTF